MRQWWKQRPNRAGAWAGFAAGAVIGPLSARLLPLSDPLPAAIILGLLGAPIGVLAGQWVAGRVNPDELNVPDDDHPFVGTHAPDDDLSGAAPKTS